MGRRDDVALPELVERARGADPRAVARLITMVESGSPGLPELAALLVPDSGYAHVVGLTGAPGVGKSTATSALVGALRRQERRVGVLAVDPTSPFSGGALLGDRIRMQTHATDAGVLIRSMATRGHLGGLAAAVPLALRVLDAARCDVTLLETVGVGQSEVDVAGSADTTLVLLAPGLGDGVQAAKAGVLEIADVFVVNKADRDGAGRVAADLRQMLGLGGPHSAAGSWRPMIVMTSAEQGTGIDDVLAAIAKHRAWLDGADRLHQRRVRRAAREIEGLTLAQLRARLGGVRHGGALAELAAAVVERRTDAHAAARLLADGAIPPGSGPSR
ncbi:methylmalonyl Co-A mutase-associated GTPase MeaB [Pseudonocardia sp. GCM10023141]|uniref:methylmalonyl Co-A mutase-associated GTPase MeaB n=1 Tax=Pseudonocardia sp. GCM10023141 TaxID=3252653 RepID=UPI0036185D75